MNKPDAPPTGGAQAREVICLADADRARAVGVDNIKERPQMCDIDDRKRPLVPFMFLSSVVVSNRRRGGRRFDGGGMLAKVGNVLHC